MSRIYLRPNSVNLPSQGDYLFQPRTKFFETQDDLPQLETDINSWLSITQLALIDTFIVIEDIQYQLECSRLNNNSPKFRYSAMVWYTEVLVN